MMAIIRPAHKKVLAPNQQSYSRILFRPARRSEHRTEEDVAAAILHKDRFFVSRKSGHWYRG